MRNVNGTRNSVGSGANDAAERERLASDLFVVDCPKCGSIRLRSEIRRPPFLVEEYFWLMECKDCGHRWQQLIVQYGRRLRAEETVYRYVTWKEFFHIEQPKPEEAERA